MPLFLVERYVSETGQAGLEGRVARALAAAADAQAAGRPVRYLWSAFVPSEEACFCLFEAPDRTSVEELNRLAEFAYDRVVEVVGVLRPGDSP